MLALPEFGAGIGAVEKLHPQANTRVDSLKKVTLASGESDTLPHIRGNFHMLENHP